MDQNCGLCVLGVGVRLGYVTVHVWSESLFHRTFALDFAGVANAVASERVRVKG